VTGAAEKKKLTEKIFYTLWDSWEVKEGDLTLGQMLDHFQKKFNLEVSGKKKKQYFESNYFEGVFNGATMVYVPLFPGHAKRKTSKYVKVYKEINILG
jgi:hypothetical protein